MQWMLLNNDLFLLAFFLAFVARLLIRGQIRRRNTAYGLIPPKPFLPGSAEKLSHLGCCVLATLSTQPATLPEMSLLDAPAIQRGLEGGRMEGCSEHRAGLPASKRDELVLRREPLPRVLSNPARIWRWEWTSPRGSVPGSVLVCSFSGRFWFSPQSALSAWDSFAWNQTSPSAPLLSFLFSTGSYY